MFKMSDRVIVVERCDRKGHTGIVVWVKKFNWSDVPYVRVKFNEVANGLTQESWYLPKHLELQYTRNLVRLETYSFYE